MPAWGGRHAGGNAGRGWGFTRRKGQETAFLRAGFPAGPQLYLKDSYPSGLEGGRVEATGSLCEEGGDMGVETGRFKTQKVERPPPFAARLCQRGAL